MQRIPKDKELSFISCERRISRPGDNSIFAAGKTERIVSVSKTQASGLDSTPPDPGTPRRRDGGAGNARRLRRQIASRLTSRRCARGGESSLQGQRAGLGPRCCCRGRVSP